MKRYPLPDLIKGFAVFFMIQIHIMELFINNAGRENLTGNISMFLGGPFAAPVFMMVMGYFVSLSNKNTFQLLQRGILVFLLGLLLNIGLNFNLLLKIKFSGWQFDPLEYIFGVDILFLAGLSIVILGLLKGSGKLQGYLMLLLIAGITFSTPIMNSLIDEVSNKNYVLPFVAGNASWSYFPLFPWLAYPLAGCWFQKNESRIEYYFKIKPRWSYFLVVMVLLISVLRFSGFGFRTSVDLPLFYHHDFRFFLWTLGVVLIWAVLLKMLIKKVPSSKILNLLKWTGKNVTLIYVVQWLIIGNIATEIYRTQPIKGFIWWFAGVSIFCSVLVYLFELIKKYSAKFFLNQ
jgi:uncharacterized membrane protein